MRVLRPKVLLGFAALTVAAVAVGFILSSPLQEIKIEREVVIAADAQTTFDLVRYQERFPLWSPFLEQDPTQQYVVKGTDGQPGAQFHWNGRDGEDIGFQQLDRVIPGERLEFHCEIEKPFVATPTFTYTFEQVPGGTRVQQQFALTSGRIDAFFMYVFGARSEMEATNRRGLELLRLAAEGASAPTGTAVASQAKL